MHDPASKDLISRLEQYTGCRERDLVSCRKYVRQLSRDLPAFDSIWLDALVQSRLLTPFQADRLASGDAKSLQRGRYQLVNQLMQDAPHYRYLGRDTRTGQRVLIEEHRLMAPLPENSLRELEVIRDRLSRIGAEISVLAPLEFLAEDNRLCAVYPFERGMTVRELLIRRGRFPEKLVRILTRQLLAQLEALANQGIVHGDLRASNLLLSRRGQITLLNTGLRPHLVPHWTVQTKLPFEAFDTFPPDVIKTGQWNTASDLYSAGCLLWQLACGRPPLHSADSLLKLKSHLTRAIPDVREYAPEIDAVTAQRIQQLTQQDPLQRRKVSVSRQESQQALAYSSRQMLKTFIQNFEQPLPAVSGAGRNRLTQPALWATAVVLLLGCLTGAATFLLSSETLQQLRNPLLWQLSIAGNSTGVEARPEPESSSAAVETRETLPLPKPDEQGRLVLQPGQRYAAEDLSVVGPLLIMTAGSQSTEEGVAPQKVSPAIVEVNGRPWQLWATELKLQQLVIECVTAPEEPEAAETLGDFSQNPGQSPGQNSAQSPAPNLPAALVLCQSLNFRAENCRWQMQEAYFSSAEALWKDERRTRAIAWRPLEASEVNGGFVQLKNCEFHLPGSSVMLGGVARNVRFENCLKTGRGELLELSDQLTRQQYPQLTCQHVTLREADALLNLHFYLNASAPAAGLSVQAENCVFLLHQNSTGLITFSGTEPPQTRLRELNLSGQILLLNPAAAVTGWWNPETRLSTPVDFPGTVEGLMAYNIQFPGEDLTNFAGSVLVDYTGPRWNSWSPGIKPEGPPVEKQSARLPADNR